MELQLVTTVPVVYSYFHDIEIASDYTWQLILKS